MALSARKGLVVVRRGKGDAYREVPLNAAVRATFDAYMKERIKRGDAVKELALFLNPQGRRLSNCAIDLVVREFGRDAGLALSAHVGVSLSMEQVCTVRRFYRRKSIL